MRALQGQFSDNVAIRRTVPEKELLIKQLEHEMTAKSKPLKLQISMRIKNLREEIRTDRREEAIKAEAAVVRTIVRQMESERRPRRQRPLMTTNAVLGTTKA